MIGENCGRVLACSWGIRQSLRQGGLGVDRPKRRVQSIVDYEGGSRMTASVSLLHRSQCLFKELVDFTHELRVELAHLESVYSLREGV